jgi:hypothetical protein
MTLNNGLQEEFKKLLATPEYLQLMREKDLNPKVLIGAFDAILQTKGQLNFDENNLENAKVALVQNLRNAFLTNMS